MSLEVFPFLLAFSLGFEKDLIFSPIFSSSAVVSELLGSMILIFNIQPSLSVSNGVSISVALGSAIFLHSLFHHSSSSLNYQTRWKYFFQFLKGPTFLALIPNR